MKKKYIASVKYEGKNEIIESEYESKKEFAKDLKRNGYKTRFITTEEKFDSDCKKYIRNLEIQRSIYKQTNKYDKEQAKKYKISVAHYKRAYKIWMQCHLDMSVCIDIAK